jgi:hypothetical protein
MFKKLLLAAVLSAPLFAPMAASAGTVVDNTTVTASQTIAGSFNSGEQDLSGIANGGKFVAGGRGASITKDTTVDLSQTIAGVGNVGLQSAKGIANGGLFYAGRGRGPASIEKNTTVDLNQTIAGEFNAGAQTLEGVANKGVFVAGKPFLRGLRRD